jgi:hypothetical protein
MVGPTPRERGKTRDWIYDAAKPLMADAPDSARVVTREIAPPTGFPPQVTVRSIQWMDWSEYIRVPDVNIATPTQASDVVAICNWAATQTPPWTVRAVGESHNWSPILLAPGTPPGPRIMLVETTLLNEASLQVVDGMPLATFQTGITMDEASLWLSQCSSPNTDPPGYAFPHVPAPGNLTIGGVLAIGGHGTLVPSNAANDSAFNGLMGGLSNLVVAFQAVVSDPQDPGAYTLMNFNRSETDAAAFLVHLGRAFITQVTLRVVPNYYLQLTPMFPAVSDVFAPPTNPLPTDAFANLLDTYGRVEVLWFPYTQQVFAQCNMLETSEIQPQVSGPYNYPWMNNIGPFENAAIQTVLMQYPDSTPHFTDNELALTMDGLANVNVLNGIARDLEIYLKDTTLQVQLWGWVLQLPRANVQAVASQFYDQLNSMLLAAEPGSYPVNAAMEIRCTTIDQLTNVGVSDPVPAALASTHPVTPGNASIDTVIWLNVGGVVKTPGAYAFFTSLETWLINTWGKTTPNYLRPEWSKAFAYTPDGPWTNTDTLAYIRGAYNQTVGDAYRFDWAAQTLAKYDQANLFTNPFIETLFGGQ